MFEPTTPDLDRITRWRVLMNVGKPVEHKALIIPWRLIGLGALLILVSLWGLGARGAEREPVQKGRGGLAQIQIPALEKSKNFRDLSAPTAFNFLEKYRHPVSPAAPASPKSTFTPESFTEITSFDTSAIRQQDRLPFLLLVLCLVLLLIVWISLKAEDRREKSLRGTGGRR